MFPRLASSQRARRLETRWADFARMYGELAFAPSDDASAVDPDFPSLGLISRSSFFRMTLFAPPLRPHEEKRASRQGPLMSTPRRDFAGPITFFNPRTAIMGEEELRVGSCRVDRRSACGGGLFFNYGRRLSSSISQLSTDSTLTFPSPTPIPLGKSRSGT